MVKIAINMPRIPQSIVPEVQSRTLISFLSAEYQRRCSFVKKVLKLLTTGSEQKKKN